MASGSEDLETSSVNIWGENHEIFVAVGDDPIKNKLALLWALRNFEGKGICILRVDCPADRTLSTVQEREYRRKHRETVRKLLYGCVHLCRNLGVSARIVRTKNYEIAEGIVKLIFQHCIRILVMGLGEVEEELDLERGYSLRMAPRLKNTNAAEFVCQYAPAFCEILIISWGRKINARDKRSTGRLPRLLDFISRTMAPSSTQDAPERRFSQLGSSIPHAEITVRPRVREQRILVMEESISLLEKVTGQLELIIEEIRSDFEVGPDGSDRKIDEKLLAIKIKDLGHVKAEKELVGRELEALKHAEARKDVLSDEILPGVENKGIRFGVEESGKQTASDIDRHELINENIQPKGRLILFGAGSGLTVPPKIEDWENVKEICLMDNELSVLPENPKCPILSSLFLQRNYKLRTVPPSFFDYMPALEILNLSRTSIKSLPESIIRLVSLKRLFLNHCLCFMILTPRVGELKQLEVLDLEGTEIFDLPEQVKKLSNLICLELSLYGFTSTDSRAKQSNAMVSGGVISALYQLEELNIDVNTDDPRWNACVEAIVSEVAELKWLNTLKFYFPTVELLGKFIFYSYPWTMRSLTRFRFTVGDHVNRIMSRLTPDVEFELERWDRCLKYINGVDVPVEIKFVLRRANAFFLERHATVRRLSDFGNENLNRLKCCVLGECNEVQEIIDASVGDDRVILASLEYLYIYYMKNLRSIWTGSLLHQKSLSLLKSLTLHTCPMLTTIFTVELLQKLHNLEVLTVEDCPSVINLVSGKISVRNKTPYFLPSLIRMSLHYMPGLVSISNGLRIAPKLELVSIYDCPNLKTLFIDEAYHINLRKIKGFECQWMVEVEIRGIYGPFLVSSENWKTENADDAVDRITPSGLQILPEPLISHYLRMMNDFGCDSDDRVHSQSLTFFKLDAWTLPRTSSSSNLA